MLFRSGGAEVAGGRGRGWVAAETAAALSCTGAVADAHVGVMDGDGIAASKRFEEDVREVCGRAGGNATRKWR